MPLADAEALIAALEAIAAGHLGSLDIKALKDTAASYRLRHGDWRAVYRIDAAVDVLYVERAGHRREIYR
ncbi:MAG TPA: type II toxin-antitoxin system RelE/ParE family toxin [Stellaceae bacterium]|nr:type II toxin-antitoxin system RelE/ParE family toxin [Stellaceae bacterium]